MTSGQRHFRQGRARQAAITFRQAVAVTPERIEGWINLGSALLEIREYTAAVEVLQKAIAMKPNVMVPHMLLGDALRLMGETALSLESYKRAVALDRTPDALNRLACALRSRARLEEAEKLYYEAVRRNPAFTLARVNLATMQIERKRFTEARRQLMLLEHLSLTGDERQEVESALHCIEEHSRLFAPIDVMVEHGNLVPLQASLSDMARGRVRVDDAVLGAFQVFVDRARSMTAPPAIQCIPLPEEWPLIEAMHMIPFVDTVADYVSVRDRAGALDTAAEDLRESFNMEPAIRAARCSRDDMSDPIKAEVHLRHWHALACRDIAGFMPGHFKYTQNWSARIPTLPRVSPAQGSGTFRSLIEKIYTQLPPGLLRAIVVFLAVYDLHFFADGNARVGMVWMNRELEWAGHMPVLFSRQLGFKGQLGAALVAIRNQDGNFDPLLAVIRQAQQYALNFCSELAGQRRDGGPDNG